VGSFPISRPLEKQCGSGSGYIQDSSLRRDPFGGGPMTVLGY
jgi:hypothetical protein